MPSPSGKAATIFNAFEFRRCPKKNKPKEIKAQTMQIKPAPNIAKKYSGSGGFVGMIFKPPYIVLRHNIAAHFHFVVHRS